MMNHHSAALLSQTTSGYHLTYPNQIVRETVINNDVNGAPPLAHRRPRSQRNPIAADPLAREAETWRGKLNEVTLAVTLRTHLVDN